MTKTYTGGCACGAIRYETSSEPIFENHCQCRDCQKRSGTGHGSYLVFPRRADVSVAGEAKDWRVAGDSGNEKVHAFFDVLVPSESERREILVVNPVSLFRFGG